MCGSGCQESFISLAKLTVIGDSINELGAGKIKPFAVIVSLMFLVFFSVSSDAFVYTDTSTIDFTDNNAHRFHDFGDGHYSTGLVLGAIGGPSSNDSMGYASQFSVLERTHLTTINYDMHTVSDSISQNRQIFFDFIIYEGNVYNGGLGLPNTDKVLYRSPVELNFDIVGTNPDGSPIYSDVKDYFGLENKIDLTLNGGLYWIAYERSLVPNTDTLPGMGIGEFSSAIIKTAPADYNQPTVPEPATMFLMGSGLIGMVFQRRKMFKK